MKKTKHFSIITINSNNLISFRILLLETRSLQLTVYYKTLNCRCLRQFFSFHLTLLHTIFFLAGAFKIFFVKCIVGLHAACRARSSNFTVWTHRIVTERLSLRDGDNSEQEAVCQMCCRPCLTNSVNGCFQ